MKWNTDSYPDLYHSAHTQTIIPFGKMELRIWKSQGWTRKIQRLVGKNIHNPSITVYAPSAATSNGTEYWSARAVATGS